MGFVRDRRPQLYGRLVEDICSRSGFEAAVAFQVGTVERLGQPQAAAPAARPAHDGAAFDPAREYAVELLADLEMAVMDEAGAVLRQIDAFDRRRRAFVGHRLGLRLQ